MDQRTSHVQHSAELPFSLSQFLQALCPSLSLAKALLFFLAPKSIAAPGLDVPKRSGEPSTGIDNGK